MRASIGPYRISDKLGTGGMGEVFKAYDDRLGRWVAIKRIRPGKEADENRRRFRREARATARLNHASIVHVYDIFQDGDSECIVMEFVEGRTLQSITAEARLEPRRAVEVALEIAEGLAEAHSKGILHRDLKSENILVTPEGHAKILDFGLAKPLLDESDPGLTGKGQLVGTSRTMSPEYVGGETRIDHRADLFSFGVLLYETLTGRSPFKAQSTMATLKQIMIHHPPPANELDPRVPDELSELIERLLEKSPEDRPQNASEVADRLRRVFEGLPSPAKDPSSTELVVPPPGLRRWGKLAGLRRRRWGLLLAVLVAAAVAVGFWLGRRTPAAGSEFSFARKDRIVLGDFENLTGEPLLDDSLELAFRVGLEQSRFSQVLPASQVREALLRMQRDPATAVDRSVGIEICQREGAKALVIGSIGKVGTAYSLSAEVLDPRSGQSVFSTPPEQAGDQGKILAALDRVTQAVRANLGESLAAISADGPPLEKVTTRHLEALQAYSMAVSRLSEERYPEAVSLFERAIDIDPDFAMAYAKLGVLYHNVELDRTKAAGYLRQALALRDRLTEFERLYVEGWLANLESPPREMVRVWSLVSTLYPERDEAHYNLGMVRWLYYNQFEDATASFEKAAQRLDPSGRQLAFRYLGYCQLARDDYDGAISSFRQVHPPVDLADTYVAAGRYSAARAFLDEIAGSGALPPDDILERRVLLDADRGRFRAALKTLDQLDEPLHRNQLLSRAIARATLQARIGGDAAALREDLTRAVALAGAIESSSLEQYAAAPVPALAVLGKLAARAGFLDLARSARQRIAPQAGSAGVELWTSYAALLDAEILFAQGRGEEAVARLRESQGRVETFQAHASLAHMLEAQDDFEAARSESAWLVEHRGRTFAECRWTCHVRLLNVIEWSTALWRLGRLEEATGHGEAARDLYRRLAAQWQDGENVAEVRQRLAGLAVEEAVSPQTAGD